MCNNVIAAEETDKENKLNEWFLTVKQEQGTPVARIECLEEIVDDLEGKGQVEAKMCSVDYNYNKHMKDSEMVEHYKVGNLTLAAESCGVLNNNKT